LFRLDGASAGYNGHAVLKDISLVIEAGERVALVGESGAGKSTLLGMLYEQQRSRAALIPQDTALVRSLSVFHNIYIGRLHHHKTLYNLRTLVWPARAEVARVRAITDRLRLSDKLFTPVGELSGGQQQRTAVGRALFHGGEVVLGDEPVSAVDEHQAREILTALADSHRTVVLAMHDLDLALAHTQRIVGIRGGAIALDAPSSALSLSDLAPLYKT
jgi:phosphonate transport system ATP-binding protein